MLKVELFDVLKEQLFDRLVNYDALRQEIFSRADYDTIDDYCKIWPPFAKECAASLNQIATTSRLERYEYQETLSENIKALKNNPKAFEVVVHSRDQSILQEFFARILSLLYYETILEGLVKEPKDLSVIDEYSAQVHDLSEIILFSLGKELHFDEEFLKIMTTIGRMNFESNIYSSLQSFQKPKKEKHKELLLERKIKNLRYKGTLYMIYYSRVLDIAKDDFWWNDNLLKFYIYNKADKLFTEAKAALEKNPVDPSLFLTIDFEIALCRGQAKLATGSHFLELAINALLHNNHQRAYKLFNQANKAFNESLAELNEVPLESSSSQALVEEIRTNIDFTEIFSTLVALTCSILELSSTDLPQKELRAKIKSLTSLSEAPLTNIEFYNQSEFLNTVGFILENLTTLSKHEKLTAERIRKEIQKGFRRLGVIFKGRVDNIARAFLNLPWQDDEQDLTIKNAFCETETEKIQDILMSILLMPPFIDDRTMLISKSRVLLNIITCEATRLKGLREKNATKGLCLLVKSFLSAKEAYENLPTGKVLDELKFFVKEEFSKTFIQSHLKEANILHTGNQYFFARYLLRSLPDVLSSLDLKQIPAEISSLIIESHGALFDSLITIWQRLASHYKAILDHKNKYQVLSEDIVDWEYINKKHIHTTAAMLFFQSCQAIIKAQEYAQIRDRSRAQKLYAQAEKFAKKSAKNFATVLDTLKGEVQQLATDLFNFASFCKTQHSKISQGQKADELPIKDFVVLIGIISSSL
ncbi:MAG: hypothetical protein ACTSUA_06385 [Candidatus Heimdallarchaeota archaeon]